MAYCTLSDLIKALPKERIIELSDDSGNPTEINENNTDEAILKASNEIDGFIRGRYTLPLDTVPAIIKDISIDLAIYYLWIRRPERAAPEGVLRRYRDRIERLKGIQKGIFLLEIAQIKSSSGKGEYRINKTFNDRIFAKNVLDTF
ncbi:MAG: hypothetical protein BWY64_01210 [bacterium ADurb.Bin363]|nr:MAG: hypothetical protein BWY64_01210 [bacterium ADurb.Bin363]